MSRGAIYSIIVRQTIDDQYLDAMDVLKNVLIRKMIANGAQINDYVIADSNQKYDFKSQNYDFLKNYKDYIPSMAYLDNSVALFLNYSYKPFVMVAQEYNVVRPLAPSWNGEVRVNLNKYGQFLTDCVVHVQLTGLRTKSPLDRVKYIDRPGARIFDRVQFQINRTVIDEYNFETYNQHYDREVQMDKRRAWSRMMGQQDEYPVNMVPDPLNDFYSTRRTYSNGAQTFKQRHDTLDMWVPLLFWFKDFKTALPLYMLNWGQIEIVFKLTDPSNLVSYCDFGGGGAFETPKITTFELYSNNIYTDELVYRMFMLKIRMFMIRTHRQSTHLLTDSDGRIRLFDRIKWPVERLTVSFRPQENESKSEYWYRNSVLTPNHIVEPVLARNAASVIANSVSSAAADTAFLQGALSITNSYYNGYYFNITGGTGYNTDDIQLNRYYILQYTGATNTVRVNRPWSVVPDSTTTYEMYLPQLQAGQSIFYTESSPIQTVEVSLNSNVQYIEKSDVMLHDSYGPYRTNGIVAAASPGCVEVYFQLEKHDQLRGYYPFSDAESYFNYTSTYISTDTPATAYISATAINFFIVDATGAARLLYP